MISVAEYARSRGISRESVNKQLRRKPVEIEGHVFPRGKSFDLDDDAISYLDEHRQPRVLTIEPLPTEIQEEIDKLRKALETAQNELAKSQAMVISLQEEKLDLIEKNGKYQGLIESHDRERREKDERIAAQDETIREQDAMIKEHERTISADAIQINNLENQSAAQQEELALYEKTIFGLYRKKKRTD